jgi:hypothetical protein
MSPDRQASIYGQPPGIQRRRQIAHRGASIVQLVTVIGACAALSAVLFPMIAAPVHAPTVGVMEIAAADTVQAVWLETRDHALRQLRHTSESKNSNDGHIAGTTVALAATSKTAL